MRSVKTVPWRTQEWDFYYNPYSMPESFARVEPPLIYDSNYGMPSVPKCDILVSTDITYFCGQILFNCCLFLLIQIQTFHSDTDILFGYRHFIRVQTFYLDTDILFGYRHFILI